MPAPRPTPTEPLSGNVHAPRNRIRHPFGRTLQSVSRRVRDARDLGLGSTVQGLNTKAGGILLKAAEAAEFKGKAKTSFELLATAEAGHCAARRRGRGQDRGQGRQPSGRALAAMRWDRSRRARRREASFIVDIAGVEREQVGRGGGQPRLWRLLRHYQFKKYLTKKAPEEGKEANGNGTPAKDGLESCPVRLRAAGASRNRLGGARRVGQTEEGAIEQAVCGSDRPCSGRTPLVGVVRGRFRRTPERFELCVAWTNRRGRYCGEPGRASFQMPTE